MKPANSEFVLQFYHCKDKKSSVPPEIETPANTDFYSCTRTKTFLTAKQLKKEERVTSIFMKVLTGGTYLK